MRKLLVLLSVLVVLLTTTASQAEPLPRDWRGTTKVTQHHVTYRIRKSDGIAVVVRTTGSNVRIPYAIRHRGATYKVCNIWSEALRGAKVIRIEADLDGCESARLWQTTVRVTRRDMYRWLSRTGADVCLV